MSDLLKEVDEIMREERLMKFWHENRNYIIGVIVGTILLTGAISGYRTWNNSVKESQTAAVIALQDAENYPENILNAKNLKLRAGLRGIALLRAAGAFIDQDKEDEALNLYARAAGDKGIPAELRHLGILMAVRLQIDKENTDHNALLKTLQPALKDKNSPWQNHARVEAAVINAKLKNYDAAIALLNAVQDAKNIPDTLVTRAVSLARLYTLESHDTAQTGS